MHNFLNIKPHFLKLLINFLLAALILFSYGQVKRFQFVSYDDSYYVTENPHVRAGLTGKGVLWAFTNNYAYNWIPVTWLSHMLICEVYGLDPAAHHWTNVQLHIANTLLLFFIFQVMTGAVWRSAFVAALFALHPLHVESVAWVAERKDVLSTFWGFWAILAYIFYVRKPNTKRYLPVVLFFSLGLMSKPMLVTLPFLLLLLDFWPLERYSEANPIQEGSESRSIGSLVWEKMPLFAISAVSCGLTVFLEKRGGAIASLDLFPIKVRVANALVSYLKYMGKMIWPQDLAIFYPYDSMLKMGHIAASAVVLICLSALAIRTARRYPYLVTGWFWFLGTLIPVIGLIQVGPQSMADRYTYLPIIGLFVILVWGVADMVSRFRFKDAVIAALVCVVLPALMICTWFQVRHWENSYTLFTRALNVTKNNWLAHVNMGAVLLDKGRTNEAIYHFEEAVRIKTDSVDALNNLALAHSEKGNIEEATRFFQKALMIDPEDASVHYNFGIHLFDQGKIDDAGVHLFKAVKLKPDYAEAYNLLGIVLAKQGRFQKARVFFSKAVYLKPDYDDPLKNLEILKQLSPKAAQQAHD
ncbi:tetratricopeptide repeat protein [Thermodesulfobacteriota bacterium]